MFTGNENHFISLADAANFTARFRETITHGSKIGGFVGRATIEKILEQANVVGIRYYYGIDDEGKNVLILVGTDADGNDLYNGELAEISLPCPDYCASANPLNSDI